MNELIRQEAIEYALIPDRLRETFEVILLEWYERSRAATFLNGMIHNEVVAREVLSEFYQGFYFKLLSEETREFAEFLFFSDMKKYLDKHCMFYIDQYRYDEEYFILKPKPAYHFFPLSEVW